MVKPRKKHGQTFYLSINLEIMNKWRFKKQFEDAQINVAIMHKTVNKENLTDADVEFLISKFPNKFDHNFELVQGEEVQEVSKPYPSDEPNEEWTVEQLKAYAKDNGVKLGRAKTEQAILKRIKGE